MGLAMYLSLSHFALDIVLLRLSIRFFSVSWFLNTIGIHRHIHTPHPFSPQYVVMVASMVPQPGECGFFVWDTCVTVAFVQKFLYFASALAGTIGFQTGALKLS